MVLTEMMVAERKSTYTEAAMVVATVVEIPRNKHEYVARDEYWQVISDT